MGAGDCAHVSSAEIIKCESGSLKELGFRFTARNERECITNKK